VPCGAGDHRALLAVGSIGLVGFVLGYPLAVATVARELWRLPTAPVDARFVRRFGALYHRFWPEASCWYELVNVMRRLLLVGISVLVTAVGAQLRGAHASAAPRKLWRAHGCATVPAARVFLASVPSSLVYELVGVCAGSATRCASTSAAPFIGGRSTDESAASEMKTNIRYL